jgi:hypothetical protein
MKESVAAVIVELEENIKPLGFNINSLDSHGMNNCDNLSIDISRVQEFSHEKDLGALFVELEKNIKPLGFNIRSFNRKQENAFSWAWSMPENDGNKRYELLTVVITSV